MQTNEHLATDESENCCIAMLRREALPARGRVASQTFIQNGSGFLKRREHSGLFLRTFELAAIKDIELDLCYQNQNVRGRQGL